MAKYFKRILLLVVLGALSFSTPPALLTVASYIYFHSSDAILPHVSVGSVEVGGLTIADAQEAIDLIYNQQSELLLIEVPSAQRSWNAIPGQFGLQVDALESAVSAHELGRQGGYFTRITDMLRILRSGQEIQPVIEFDADKASLAVDAWSEILHRDPVDASVELSGSKVQVHPAEPGLQLDVARTLSELTESYKQIYLELGWLPLYTQEIPSERFEIDEIAARLETLLSSSVEIRAYDPVTDEHFTWRPTRDVIAGWISLEHVGDQIRIEIDPQEIRAYVDGLNTFLGSERFLEQGSVVDAIMSDLTGSAHQDHVQIISYYPSQYTVKPGDTLVSIGFRVHLPYWKLFELNPTLSTQGLSVGQTLQVPPRDDLLTLAVIPDKRIEISISEQRMNVYEQGELKWQYVISTGISDSPTLPGIFQISSHFENAYASIWDLYMPHFMGIYDAVPGLTNGIHGLPLLSNGRRLWANVLGNPASYGCIILDLDAAEQLFYWAEEGVVVEIRE
ncbi:MAG: peptidoglycan binding domain-containing protein [Anaerolineales bacterium]|jgi:LysM repeat protein